MRTTIFNNTPIIVYMESLRQSTAPYYIHLNVSQNLKSKTCISLYSKPLNNLNDEGMGQRQHVYEVQYVCVISTNFSNCSLYII